MKVDAELLRVAAAAAAMPSEQWGKFSGVSGFRYYKKNPQWQVRWSADGATSWETWDKLDSEPIRTAATAVAPAMVATAASIKKKEGGTLGLSYVSNSIQRLSNSISVSHSI